MPYTINHYDGQQLVQVQDATIDSTTCDIKLIGRNYAGYGEAQNENYLFLLENFANTTQPLHPVTGQIWYDTSSNKLKFHDGNSFIPIARMESCYPAPTYTPKVTGDLWYNTTDKQLFIWDGSTFGLVGPEQSSIFANTKMRPRKVKDTNGGEHFIIEALVNNVVIFTISSDAAYTLNDSENPITGFDTIHEGITLVNTKNAANGQTSSVHRYWGTATNAERLNGQTASSFHPMNGGSNIDLTAANLIAATSLLVPGGSGDTGKIRYSSGSFQGYTGSGWVNFSTGSYSDPYSSVLQVGSNPTSITVGKDAPSKITVDNTNGIKFVGTSSIDVSSYSPLAIGSDGKIYKGTSWPSSGGSMVYPSGTGLVRVSNGSWGTTITLPNNAAQYLNGTGNWTIPSSGGTDPYASVLKIDTANSRFDIAWDVLNYNPGDPGISARSTGIFIDLGATVESTIDNSSVLGIINVSGSRLGKIVQSKNFQYDTTNNRVIMSANATGYADNTPAFIATSTAIGVDLGLNTIQPGPALALYNSSRVVESSCFRYTVLGSRQGAIVGYNAHNWSPSVTAAFFATNEGLFVDLKSNYSPSNTYPLYVSNDAASAGLLTPVPGSDIALKTNIKTLSNSLDKVLNLNPVSFNYKTDLTSLKIGLIAQEVELIISEVVGELPDGNKFIHYDKLTPILIGAIKEMKAEYDSIIAELRQEIELLKNR